jgi:6-hydroxycyclohex-1-ene-1-carbonyl-CoA dehydrogenase
MKAAVFHEAHRPLALEEVPTPTPGDGEVLVRVSACGVCHTDMHYIDHGVKTFAPPPLILGHEPAGIVEQLGPNAQGRRVGERVLLPAVFPCGRCEMCQRGRGNICSDLRMFGNNVPGAYAEFVVAPAAYCIPMPDDIPLEEGAIIADAISTPFHAVKNRARVQPGDTVVVVGCGGLGMNVLQCALAFGATVVAVDANDAKLDMARSLGAAAGLNPRTVSRPDKELKKLTGGGADVAIEAIGNPETVRLAFDSVRRGGRLCVLGFCTEEVPLALGKLMYYELEVVGSLGCPPGEYPRLIEMVRRGRIQLMPMVTAKMPLDRINDAFDLLRRGEGLRTVVLPGAGDGRRA